MAATIHYGFFDGLRPAGCGMCSRRACWWLTRLDGCTNIPIMNAGASEVVEPIEPVGPIEPMELPAGLAEMPPGPALAQVLSGVDPRRLTAHQLVIVVQAQN